jgi:hypothetical protein
VGVLPTACFSLATLLKAIKNGHFMSRPGFTVKNIQRYFCLPTVATVKGHLDQTRNNMQSTKKMAPDDQDNIVATPPITDGKCTNFVDAAFIDLHEPTGHIYTDQTGCFPTVS